VPNPSFIALGDIHLDHWIWRKYRQIRGDSFVAFTGLVDLALEHHVPLVLVGDIFDSVDPESDLIQFFRSEIDRCEEAGIEVFAIQGNHDRRSVPWYLAVHDWPVHIGDGRRVDINGLRCVGFDYQQRDRIEAALLELGKDPAPVDVLFLHQAVRQLLPWDGAWNCDLAWVPAQVRCVVMADIHKPWSNEFRAWTWAHYTGASHPRSVAELDPKSVLLVNDDASVTRLPLRSRPIRVWPQVRVPADVEPIRAWLLATPAVAGLEPVAWVQFGPDAAAAVQALSTIPEKLICAEPADDAPTPETRDRTDTAVLNPLEALARLVDPDKVPEVFAFASAFLTKGREPSDTLAEWRDRFVPEPQPKNP
jgi:hypothetical protein